MLCNCSETALEVLWKCCGGLWVVVVVERIRSALTGGFALVSLRWQRWQRWQRCIYHSMAIK